MKPTKLFATGLLALGLFAVACGGGDDNGGGGGSSVTIPAADADRVAHEGLPALDDLPGEGWVIIGQDQFDGSSGPSFAEFLGDTPECETLQNLAALENVFGGDDAGDLPVGRAQIEFEHEDPDALIPTNIEVEIEIEESASGSRAEFDLVKQLFQSDDTSNCLIAVLNNQFAESGPAGVEIEVTKASGSAAAPENGALMAFDIDMNVFGLELSMAMEMYFWPYGNANLRALFLGTNESLTGELVGGVLTTTNNNLKAAAGR